MSFVEEDDGMEVAVAGVEDVDDAEIVLLFGLADEFKDFGESGAGNDAILGAAAGGESSDGPEGLFTGFPKELSFFFGAGSFDFASAELFAERFDGAGFVFDYAFESVGFDDEHSSGIEWEAELEGLFECFDDALIEHFECGGNDTGGDDFADGCGGIGDGVEDCEHGADGGGIASDFDPDASDDTEGTLAADEEPGEVEVVAASAGASELDELAVGADVFDTEHVIDGDAVFKGVWSAGVGGDIAADRAGPLTAGVRGVVEAGTCEGACEADVDAARLNDGIAVAEVDFEDAVHASERNHEPATDGQAAAGNAGACSARNEGHIELGTGTNEPHNFLGGHREGDDLRWVLFDDKGIAFVDEQFVGGGDEPLITDDISERLQEFRSDGSGGQSRGTGAGHMRRRSAISQFGWFGIDPAPPRQIRWVVR